MTDKVISYISRRKAETTIGDYWVSTVFIKPEASLDGNPFETMILNTKTDEWLDYQERCLDDWKQQHSNAIDYVLHEVISK
jgi:hypothetical protein|tara:strand:+ start:1133 stop:1375 length:243 start_codon:yes stop_codon:yes gene_type:complete